MAVLAKPLLLLAADELDGGFDVLLGTKAAPTSWIFSLLLVYSFHFFQLLLSETFAIFELAAEL